MYHYQCPSCGAGLELRQRVTQTNRRCPQCKTPITTLEIDGQKIQQDAALWKAGCLLPIFAVVFLLAAGGAAVVLGPIALVLAVLVIGVSLAVSMAQGR